MQTAPKNLSANSKRIWRQLMIEFDLSDCAGQTLLQVALESLDIQQMAFAEILEHGILLKDMDGNSRKNPALQTEKEAKMAFLSAIKALNLDLEPLNKTIGRPPGK